jgi:glutathione synthase/RimK-type ligase-like ATP-grasp enzyme
MAELQRRGLATERIDHARHGFDPRDRTGSYDVLVNRSSPSSYRRGHGSVLFYTEALLEHYAARGVPVINSVAAYRFEKSKALQVALFERLGVRYPRTAVVNDVEPLRKAAAMLRFPVLVKPNVGGSGALIERFDDRDALDARAETLDFGPDGVALVQEYVEPRDGAIVRVEVLDGRALYAIQIVKSEDNFNLCPADLCAVGGSAAAEACPAEVRPGLTVARHEAPADVVEQAIALTRAASIDVGGVEYLVSAADGLPYFYDLNATSNFVADAPRVLGFDPFVAFGDYIARVAGGAAARRAA